MQISIEKLARDDLVRAAKFYDKQEEGLGKDLLTSLTQDILELPSQAGIHRKVAGFFRFLASRFPYHIYYTVDGSSIRIHAVLDGRRNPQRMMRILHKRGENLI